LFERLAPWCNRRFIYLRLLIMIVMSQTPRLDDKYTSGVWYDQMNGDFAKIQRGFDPEAEGSGRIVELVNPESGNVYWDMPVREWVEREQQDFRPVSDEAVEDPVEVVNRAVRILSRNDISELSAIPHDFAVDLRYARQQVEIR
jgi:hypothetical protein